MNITADNEDELAILVRCEDVINALYTPTRYGNSAIEFERLKDSKGQKQYAFVFNWSLAASPERYRVCLYSKVVFVHDEFEAASINDIMWANYVNKHLTTVAKSVQRANMALLKVLSEFMSQKDHDIELAKRWIEWHRNSKI